MGWPAGIPASQAGTTRERGGGAGALRLAPRRRHLPAATYPPATPPADVLVGADVLDAGVDAVRGVDVAALAQPAPRVRGPAGYPESAFERPGSALTRMEKVPCRNTDISDS